MADYTDLPNSAVGIGGVPSGTTVTALRDNPIAIAEGATGAPRIVDAALDTGAATAAGTTWVALRMAGVSVGGVGTYIFGYGNIDRSEGQTISGGNLTAGGAIRSFSNPSLSVGLASGGTQSGSWRCMGYFDFSNAVTSGDTTTTVFGATLWLRIS